jgi:hypothetical protein
MHWRSKFTAASSCTVRLRAWNWLIDGDHLSILIAPLRVDGKLRARTPRRIGGTRDVSAPPRLVFEQN